MVAQPRKTKRMSEAQKQARIRGKEPGVAAEAEAANSVYATSGSPALAVQTVSGLFSEQAPGRGELRLDVDGDNLQMTASGLIVSGLAGRLHWIARLSPTDADRWKGKIWFKDGTASLLPHNSVKIAIQRIANERNATVRFSGGGGPNITRSYRRRSAYFHRVEFEYDVVTGTSALTAIDTCAHPNRPAGLPSEKLTIETVFRRAGFEVSASGGNGKIPLNVAGTNQTWSDTEMHDAMQAYWSRFANSAQWSLWVLFAALHDSGSSLGGVMFDDIGDNHRQGTAIFNNSFIAQPPAGDPAPGAWVDRMRFWTACHEMGHAFNLAHSWQKALGTGWIPLSNEPEERSFMNYPYNVAGGQAAFFSDFSYRFSNQELLFMRHAPERMVQMGNADWFDHHAFEQAETSAEPKFQVELRANRDKTDFDFLEPCVLEVKLTNRSSDPQLISEQVLQEADRMVVIIKKDGAAARQWLPYAEYCYKGRRVVLEPGASRYEALFVSAGRNGWDLAEPGMYTVQIALRIAGEDLVSNRLRIRVVPPRSHEEEFLAQDFFSDDVGRVLAFNGSRVMPRANDVLRETAGRLADRPVANHALVAVNRPLLRDGKVLERPGATATGPAIGLAKARVSDAAKGMAAALIKNPQNAARTLGHIDYKNYADTFSDRMAAAGDVKTAAKLQDQLYSTLQARKVAGWVLAEINRKRKGYAA